MRRRLAIIAVLFAFLPIYGQEKSSKTERHQAESQKVSNPINEPSISIINSVEQPAPQKHGDGVEGDSKSYLSRLFSPENLPNIGLLIAGICGIRVAIATLKAIKKQSEIMEQQLGEMKSTSETARQSAMAALEQTQIRANAFEILLNHCSYMLWPV